MQVDRIDHVHVEVTDRDQAADWYARVLGLRRDPNLASWADDPMGPLILSTSDGTPTLSLFARACLTPSRDTTVAFRVSGAAFLEFLQDIERLGLTDMQGHTLTRNAVVDHALSWSIYFVDPDRNRLEITTYDYEQVGTALSLA